MLDLWFVHMKYCQLDHLCQAFFHYQTRFGEVTVRTRLEYVRKDKSNNSVNIDSRVMFLALYTPTYLYLSKLRLRSHDHKRLERYCSDTTQQWKKQKEITLLLEEKELWFLPYYPLMPISPLKY